MKLEIEIKVSRFPECTGCKAAEDAAETFASGNPTIHGVQINDCAIADLGVAVDAHMVGVSMLPPGGDLFGREDGTVRIHECPGRVNAQRQQIDREMGLTS